MPAYNGSPESLAFATAVELSGLMRAGKITSMQLTRMYLDRLKRYGPRLLCVVNLTEELALQQAERADREMAAGQYRGPLHGIPWGAKDLLATRGIPTTWGAKPYEHQIFDYDATVVERLEAAGAVLVAKLTMGELAMGDVWFGGMTRNPWNIEAGFERFLSGTGQRDGGGTGRFQHRHGDVGQHRQPVRAQRRYGPASHFRARFPLRSHAAVMDNGQNRADVPGRGRLRPRPERHLWPGRTATPL